MDDVQRVVAQQEIYELSCRYMRGLDRLDRALLMSVFTEDAYCEYGFINGTPTEFVDYAINALTSHVANHHMIGNHLIEFEGEEAFGEIYFNAYHKVETDDGPQDIVIAGRYLDRYTRSAEGWKMPIAVNEWTGAEPKQLVILILQEHPSRYWVHAQPMRSTARTTGAGPIPKSMKS